MLQRFTALAFFVAAAGGPVCAFASAQGAVPASVSSHDRDRAQRAFVDGGKAISGKNIQAAVTAFAKAAALDPANPTYNAALLIARDNLATQIMQQALKARLYGDDATFRARYREAADADSHNPLVMEHAGDLATEDEPKQSLVNPVQNDLAPPVELVPTSGTHSFHLMLPAGEVLRQVLGAYGITPTIDSSVKTDRVSFNADDIDFQQAEQMLTLATGTFVVPLDPSRALLALDNKENRGKYERLAFETVYLPGLTTAELNDVSNIARNVFEAQQATIHESSSTLTVRAPSVRMHAFNTELNELLAGRSEVMLDVDIYEVQTEHLVNEGSQLTSSITVFNVDSAVNSLISANPTLVQQIISSGLASPGNIAEIAAALVLSGQAGSTALSQPFAYFGGGITTTGLAPSSTTANAQLSSSESRMLDRLQLRLLDQEEGSIKIGERYPIVTSSYSNLATGSTSIAGISSAGLSNTLQNLGVNLSTLSSAASATVPQVQYQDIGLSLTATPRVQQEHDVSLKLQLEISSLSGQTLNSNPIITSRKNNSIILVKPGERTVLFSQVSHQETATLIGVPLLSEIPGFEFPTNRDIDKTIDNIVVVLTPHIVRLSHTHREGQLVLLPTHS